MRAEKMEICNMRNDYSTRLVHDLNLSFLSVACGPAAVVDDNYSGLVVRVGR